MKRPAIPISRALHGLVIVMAAPVAAAGVTLGCFVRNLILNPVLFPPAPAAHRLPGTGLGDFAGAAFLALLTILWAAALVQFYRSRPRSLLSIVIILLALAVFGVCSWQAWLFAYPICNPF